MKFLVIGLGSMGKRRIRCLKSLGHADITGFDPRKDRRDEAKKLYGVATISTLQEKDVQRYDATVISTPPDLHLQYLMMAARNRRPAFVEASVILKGLDEANRLAMKNKVLLAPSCTLRYHSAVKDITALVAGGTYGKITSFSYHSGQYLPDWHPWEQVQDYYVSKKETGAAREIVAFELTWLVSILGFPDKVTGVYGRTMDVGAAIDDTYCLALRFGDSYGTLVVDVVARSAVRSLILNLERAQILWNWQDRFIRIYDAVAKRWIVMHQKEGSAQSGYNVNIIEEMYIEELGAFVNAAQGKGTYPNTLDDDMRVLRVLMDVEEGGIVS